MEGEGEDPDQKDEDEEDEVCEQTHALVVHSSLPPHTDTHTTSTVSRTHHTRMSFAVLVRLFAFHFA